MENRKYVLASGSPRRIEMMHAHGIIPRVCPADIDEHMPAAGGPADAVMFLALKKAQAAQETYEIEDGSIIIAADTVVYKDVIMGKPSSFDEAFSMLSDLRGTSHLVITGVALSEAGHQNANVFAETTRVFFKNYSDGELAEYLHTDEAYDKAGGYAIQGYFSRYIEKIEGDYDNVIGFPWDRITSELRNF